LTEDEVETIWGFVALRMAVSIVLAAEQMAARPDDPYLAISQGPIRRTLPRLYDSGYTYATAILRHACGFAPIPNTAKIIDFMERKTGTFSPIMGERLTAENTIGLDLSIGSPLLHGDFAENAEVKLTPRIFGQMADAGAKYGIGRWNEPRLIYTEDMFKTGEGMLDERRAMHVGLDIFGDAHLPVHAPLEGVVHSVRYSPGSQDYGHVIILAHATDDGTPFWTLYGHLGAKTFDLVKVGQQISAGDQIGVFGEPHENGDWPPHLHFQAITDMLNLHDEFSGVGLGSQKAIWNALVPDSSKTMLGIPDGIVAPLAPEKADTLKVRKEKIGRNLSIGYQDHVKIVRGWKQYLWDDQGRKYLDAYNNVPHVGHAHPHVVAAGQRQMGVLNTNTRYLHDLLNRYAEKLTATMPDPLSVCFFVNSASEANELAIRLMKAYTKQKDIIVLDAAYHGHTNTLIDISPYKHAGPGGTGAPDWVHTASIADVYRGPYKANDTLAGQKYAADVQSQIEKIESLGRGLGGFIAETCPSVGGQIIFPDGYLKAVYSHVKAAGGVTMADEVQTGYGRTGSGFYAFEQQGVVPDMVILGKPIGNGHPIGALVTTPEIADAFNNGMEFFSTFGGNTVSCATGIAVLEVMEREKLMAHAEQVGRYLLDGLKQFVGKYDIVGDARGAGLFLGLELVRDHETLEPAAEEASFVSNLMREHGVLVGTDGPFHNVVKIRPPMPFTTADADFLLEKLDKVLRENF
jgi:4-aminobutyrate aminotransferase-like enzyme